MRIKRYLQAFQEFVETFQETPINGAKVWVKAGTYDAGARSKYNSVKFILKKNVKPPDVDLLYN